MSPETKLGVINYLIWLDQINGFFLGASMLIQAVLILIPFPPVDIVGSTFCEWIDFPGTFYILGSAVWRAKTGIFRVLFIKPPIGFAETKMKKKFCSSVFWWDRSFILLYLFGEQVLILGVLMRNFAPIDRMKKSTLCLLIR